MPSSVSFWGKGPGTLPGNKKYVKYTNAYQSRAEVDFAAGRITVETIAKDAPELQLKQANCDHAFDHRQSWQYGYFF